MGMVRTMGTFCYVECDTGNCRKKMEHVDERLLLQLAGLCGWEKRGNQWMCPNCVESSDLKPRGTPKSRRQKLISSER